MPLEAALLESRTLRDSVATRTEVLDRVGVLAMLPDGLHVTTRLVAAYFEVGETAVRSISKRHREELSSHGMITLRGSELRLFESGNLTLSESSYPQGRAHLTLFTRRAVLNVAMLLRDSDVARRVRTYLLDVEEASRDRRSAQAPPADSVGTRMRGIEECLGDVGSALRDLAPVITRTSARVEQMERRLTAMDSRLLFLDRRLDNTERIVCGISERVAGLDAGLRALRADVARQSRRRARGR